MIQMPHEDPLVVTLKISNYLVKMVLMDGGSMVEIMFYNTFKQIGLLDEEIIPVSTPFTRFDGGVDGPNGKN